MSGHNDNDIGPALLALERQERELAERLGKVRQALEALRAVTATEESSGLDSLESRSIHPIEAVRRLFESYPNQKLTPPQVRDELKRLQESNKLISGSKNLLLTAHWVIGRLVERGIIVPTKTKGKKRKSYRKASS